MKLLLGLYLGLFAAGHYDPNNAANQDRELSLTECHWMFKEQERSSIDRLDLIHCDLLRQRKLMLEAIKEDDVETVLEIIESGFHIDTPLRHLNTPALIYATGYCHANIVRVLIEAGANVNLQGYSGRTALFEAARNACVETTRILLAVEGIDVDRPNKYGKTPYDEATRREATRSEVVQRRRDEIAALIYEASDRKVRNWFKSLTDSLGITSNL